VLGSQCGGSQRYKKEQIDLDNELFLFELRVLSIVYVIFI
jgi:hypothetical protein